MVKRLEGRLDLNFQDSTCFHLFFPMLQRGFQVEMPSDPMVRLFLEQQGWIDDEDVVNAFKPFFLTANP